MFAGERWAGNGKLAAHLNEATEAETDEAAAALDEEEDDVEPTLETFANTAPSNVGTAAFSSVQSTHTKPDLNPRLNLKWYAPGSGKACAMSLRQG